MRKILGELAACVLMVWGSSGWAAESMRDHLIGTWRLVSASQVMTDGTVRADPQTGPHGVGYLIYSDTGGMCVVIGDPDRPKWKEQSAPTEAELRSAFGGLVAYSGSFTTDEAAGTVVHRIEIDRVPNRAGTERIRQVTLAGNRLILRPTPLPAGFKDWTVEWERVGK